jgi:hypothetical protein
MSQIFKYAYPKSDFFLFLEKFCELNNNQYVFSKESLKRIKIEKDELEFCENLKKYYYKSKYYYLERDKTYKNFITIIRQICKFHHIPFTSNIKYSKSKYEIKYFIYQEM